MILSESSFSGCLQANLPTSHSTASTSSSNRSNRVGSNKAAVFSCGEGVNLHLTEGSAENNLDRGSSTSSSSCDSTEALTSGRANATAGSSPSHLPPPSPFPPPISPPSESAEEINGALSAPPSQSLRPTAPHPPSDRNALAHSSTSGSDGN